MHGFAMDPPPQALFVYGTLRQAARHPMALFLRAHARSLGPARARGRLYDLGAYPGMVAARGDDEWVHGEVHQLSRPDETLAVLDRYEGCGPGVEPPRLYERRPAPVELATGEMRPCWVYFYLGPVAEEKRILSGDYLAVSPRASDVGPV
jgi:gamma-glutamylcyclotransferase (GGCT)/AIG2-like uncharacterized protein YtfP